MSRKCQICGTGKLSGNKRSHAMNANKREWRPNIVSMNFNGKNLNVCARTLRTLRKQAKSAKVIN